jgi:hypothetical protein
MLWLVTFAAVAQGGTKYLPPKPVSGCSNQCVGGYASTPFDKEGYDKFAGQFGLGTDQSIEQSSQYHCTASGLSQIVTTTECTAAGKALEVSKGPAVESDTPMCIYDPVNKFLVANDGDYGVFPPVADVAFDANNALVLCHCRSCDEPSTSLQSPWWTVLGIALGVCFAGGAVAAARA